MKQDEIETICKERLDKWAKRLVGDHATPVLVLGVCHDEKQGQVVLCTTEEMTEPELIIFVRGTLNILIKQQARKN